MNKYTIKLTIALIFYNAMSLGIHVGGAAVADLDKVREAFKEDVQEIISDLVKKQAEEFFANAATGALSQLTSEKAQEIGSSIGQGILSQLTPEKTKEIGDNLGASLGDKFGENLVKGVATGVVGVASSAGKAVTTKVAATYTATKVAAASAVTSAKTTTAAALASPAAPFVVGGIVVTGVGVATYYATNAAMSSMRDGEYQTCLNSSLKDPKLAHEEEVNDQGLPARCDAQERLVSYWSEKRSRATKEAFKRFQETGGSWQ